MASSLVRRLVKQPWLTTLDPLVREAALTIATARRGAGPRPSSAATDALYRRGDPSNAPRALLLGHRGAMARAPENTLGAFRAAIDDGGDGVELDVQLTADAVPVVLHDDTLDRTTTLRGHPIRFEASELDACDAGSWFPGWTDDEKVPRLAEVFQLLPASSVVNVELKGPTPLTLGLERRTLEVIRDHPQIQVVVSSFHPAQLLAVRTFAPEIPIGLLFAGDNLLPLRTAWAAPVLMPDALHPHSALVDRALVDGAHQAGMRVHVWGVSGESDADRLLALGVDGLIVDDVRAIARVFSSRGLRA